MNLLRLFRQSLFSSGAACKRTLARNTRRLLPLAAALLFAATAQAQERRTTHDNDFRAGFSFALTNNSASGIRSRSTRSCGSKTTGRNSTASIRR